MLQTNDNNWIPRRLRQSQPDKKIREKIESKITQEKSQIGPVRKVQILFKEARNLKVGCFINRKKKKLVSDWRLTRLYPCSCLKKSRKGRAVLTVTFYLHVTNLQEIFFLGKRKDIIMIYRHFQISYKCRKE